MDFNMLKYSNTLKEHNICVTYNGPIWADSIEGIADVLMRRLEYDALDEDASQSVFSVFVEQINNVLMYSAEKDFFKTADGSLKEASIGTFVLGIKDAQYFIQTGNAVSNTNAEILKERIRHLNTLDNKELRAYYKQQLRAANNNPQSKGAGIGLIEVARRAAEPIKYDFEPIAGGHQYFSMYILVRKGGRQ